MTQQTIDAAPPPEALSPPGPGMTAATRNLCAGAYVDTTFRDRCLREVYYQDRRFTAPSYGFGLVTVLEHAQRARNLATWQDGSIVLTLAAATYLALVVIVVILLLPTIFALWRQKRIEDFTLYGQPPPIRWNRRKEEIAEQQTGNTIIYSNFEPFIGAGEVVSSWGFAQRLVRRPPEDPGAAFGIVSEREREFKEPPFTANQIVGYVRCPLEELAPAGAAEMSIPDLTVEDRIFQSAREDGPRRTVTGRAEMDEIIRNPTNPARHYLACQVVSWGGDVVTTVYVHMAVQGRSLYLEVTSTTMAPCNERYRVVDIDGGTGPRAWLRAATGALRGTPLTVIRAPGRLVRSLVDLTGHGSSTRAGTSRLRKDYGARVSVRQMGTRDRLRNFTQRQDILKFRRLIESRVFAHVLDFLDEHDVDTSEVRAQRATILNNNGILVGGDLNVSRGSVTNQARSLLLNRSPACTTRASTSAAT